MESQEVMIFHLGGFLIQVKENKLSEFVQVYIWGCFLKKLWDNWNTHGSILLWTKTVS